MKKLMLLVIFSGIAALHTIGATAGPPEQSENCTIADFMYPLPKVDIPAAKAFMSNVTYRNMSSGHGNQIE